MFYGVQHFLDFHYLGTNCSCLEIMAIFELFNNMNLNQLVNMGVQSVFIRYYFAENHKNPKGSSTNFIHPSENLTMFKPFQSAIKMYSCAEWAISRPSTRCRDERV